MVHKNILPAWCILAGLLFLLPGAVAGAEKLQIAVLPVDNLSGASVPYKHIRQSLITMLEEGGVDLLEEETLEKFMSKHRVRYTGGIDRSISRAFRDETGTDAVLITSIELYDDVYPPKIALTCRLVSTGDKPEILWMDSAGLAGDDSPGILGIGLIEDIRMLEGKAIKTASDSLVEYLSGEDNKIDAWEKRGSRRFRPKVFYRSPVIMPGMKYTVAVTPFLNLSQRKNAGDIMALHSVRQLKDAGEFDVIEPGIEREGLLKFRVILEDGVSLDNASIIFSMLDADLILTGSVLDYQDYQGPTGKPKVDFSIVVIERKSKEIVWASKSYNEGDDGVFFFDLGRRNTANAMTSEMVQLVVEMIAE